MAWSKLFKLNMTQDIIRLINLKQIKATHINFTSQHQYVSDNFVSSILDPHQAQKPRNPILYPSPPKFVSTSSTYRTILKGPNRCFSHVFDKITCVGHYLQYLI